MPYNVETTNAIADVKKLMNAHEMTWENHDGKRSVLYVPFNEVELSGGPDVGGAEPSLVEQVQGTADGLMLRAFAKGVAKHDKNPEVELNASTLMSKWTHHLSDDEKRAVLNEVVRKTPAILLSGRAPTHGGRELKDGPLTLRPDDSLNITGHGSPTAKVICVTPDVKSGAKLTAEQTVQRLEKDMRTMPFVVDLKAGEQAPKLKLNSCGSGGVFLKEFAEEALEQELEVEVYGYGNELVQNWTPANALSHLDMGSRFVASNTDMDAVQTLKAAAVAAKGGARRGEGEQTLELMTAGDELANQVEMLRSQEADLRAEVEQAQVALDTLEGFGWDQDTMQVYMDEIAEKKALLKPVEQKLAQLHPLVELDQLLNDPAAEWQLPAQELRDARLRDLGPALEKEAARLDVATKHKASENRPHVSVRDALKNGGSLVVNAHSHGRSVAH